MKATEPGFSGCLCGNAASSLVAKNDGIGRIMQGFYARFQDLFRHALDDAIEAGELTADLNSRMWAALLLAVTQGLSSLAQGGIDKASVDQLMDGLVLQLKRHQVNLAG